MQEPPSVNYMENNNQGFGNSLRCLQQPTTLLSIVLLLLNDHILKIVVPSWLTGKISDFAGLYFFPFLVAAGWSVLFSRLNFKPRAIGQLSFGFVAIWFFLLKSSPVVNSLTSELSSFIVGYPAKFSSDWTDIFGLTAMIPAWKLWNQNREWRQNGFAYIVLSIGAFAAIATSPALPTVETVTHLWMENETVVAFDMQRVTKAISNDGGRTWEPVYDFDEGFPKEYVSQPLVVCVPGDPDECYRINRDDIVEISEDGGTSWNTSWDLPADRKTYLNHANPGMDLGPYDLMIVQWENHVFVLAATGEEGVLRRELPDGEWERVRVENASPTPYKSTSPFDAISLTLSEIIAWFLLSIIAFHIACWLVWSANSKGSTEIHGTVQWIFFPALSPIFGIILTALFIWLTASLLGFIGPVISALVSTLRFNNLLTSVAMVTLVFCALVALAITPFTIYISLKKWRFLLIKNHYPLQVANALAWLAYLTHLATFLTGCIFWIFWAMDLISRFDVTLLFVLMATILVAFIFYRKIRILSNHKNMETDTSGL
jgi:hypothetical protein